MLILFSRLGIYRAYVEWVHLLYVLYSVFILSLRGMGTGGEIISFTSIYSHVGIGRVEPRLQTTPATGNIMCTGVYVLYDY